MSDAVIKPDGIVLYTDGSFRRNRAGWGLHFYTYTNEPLTRGIGIKQLPTKDGYQKVDIKETVTPIEYSDAWGLVLGTSTNNTAELQAMIEAMKYLISIKEKALPNVLILSDSEYVRKGMTQWCKAWIKNGWLTKDGDPVKNRELWEELIAVHEAVKEIYKSLTLKWVKGHSGNVGNDIVDTNAKTGGMSELPFYITVSEPDGYHNPKASSNDLYLKKWLMFGIGGEPEIKDGHHYYHMFNLGEMNRYGMKKEDSLRMRHSKTATLFGRRIADASFAVVRLKEPDEYIETLKRYHRESHERGIIEMGYLVLETAYKPAVQQRIQTHGLEALGVIDSNASITTSSDDLLSITVSPPRRARDGAVIFRQMQSSLEDVINKKVPKGVYTADITDALYDEVVKGKATRFVLKPTIQQTTPSIDLPFTLREMTFDVKALLGIDLPGRNTLNRLAAANPTVTMVVNAHGPESYSFSFVFETDLGEAIYQSPYTQFLTPTHVNL